MGETGGFRSGQNGFGYDGGARNYINEREWR